MKSIILFLGATVFLLAQDKGGTVQQATNCSQNFGPQSRNNTGSITCYSIDKKLADQISQIVATSKRGAQALKDISDGVETLLERLNQPVIQQAPNGINIGPGAFAPNAQVNNITATQLNINTASPGFGMLMRQRVAYQSKALVFLDTGQRIDASAKAKDELYVVVLLSTVTQNDLTDNQKRIQTVLTTLQALEGIRVFYSPGPGAYTLVKHDMATTVGGGLALDADLPGAMYYFDAAAEAAAKRIKDALGGDSLIKRFQRRVLPTGQDGLYTDIFAVSGVDVEVVL